MLKSEITQILRLIFKLYIFLLFKAKKYIVCTVNVKWEVSHGDVLEHVLHVTSLPKSFKIID